MQPHPPGKRHGAGGKLVPRERGQGPGHPKPQGPEQTRPASAQPPAQQATATETPRSSRGGAPRPRELEVGQRARGCISLLRGPKAPGHTRGGTEAQAGGKLPPPGPQGQRPHGPLGHQSNFTPRSAASAQRSATRVRAPRRETGPSPPCAGLKSRQEFWQIYRRKQEKRVTQTPRGCQCAHRAGQA